MKRLCSGAGCGRAIPDDARFCAECTAERGGTSADTGRQHSNASRDIYAHLYSGVRWTRTTRPKALKKYPTCARCPAITEIIDHIVPAIVAIAQAQASGLYPYDKYAGFYFISNLQGLCRSCHHAKTIEDKAHVGEWPDTVAKQQALPKKVWSF